MRLFLLCLLFPLCFQAKIFAQQDSLQLRPKGNNVTTASQKTISVLDSVVLATQQREKFVADSIAMQYIRYPDSATIRKNIAASLKEKLYAGSTFLDIPSKSKSTLKEGASRKTRDQWIVAIILALLIYTAILNLTIHKDINSVLQSFYSKRAVAQAGKDEGYINFWSFVAFFLLFGATFGLFLYQLSAYEGRYYRYSGLQLFIFLSLVVISLFAVKFLVLKFLGFIFDINKLVSEYVSILYLTYFNIAFVFLPVCICFSLLDAQFISYLLYLALAIILVIFTWLYLRSSVNIISSFRFHKFYLIVYLCALEICPVLILVKALNI